MLALVGGLALGMDGLRFEPADILIRDDRIVAIGPVLDFPEDAERLDVSGCCLLPGLINAHTHAHNNLTRGAADNWSLEDLRNYGPALYSRRSPEDHYLSAALGAIEMLKAGCTAAYDQFSMMPAMTSEMIDAVIQAYLDVGIRAVLAPAASDIPFYRAVPGLIDLLPSDLEQYVADLQMAPAENLLTTLRQAIKRWHNHQSGRIRMATAPAIPGECTDGFFHGCMQMTREFGIGLQTHLAETKIQAINAQRRWGKTLVRHLADEGLLGPGFVAGHAVWVTDADIGLMADHGAMVAHNPASNLKLGSGIAPVQEMLERGIIVGIGTDGSMSSDNQNMFEAMRIAALANKVRFPHEPERWIGSRKVWAMVTTAGASVMGASNEIGALLPGYKADIVLLRQHAMYLNPRFDALNSLIYAETGSDVQTVLVDGRVVVRDGKVTTVDEEAIRQRAQTAMDEAIARNSDLWEVSRRMSPFVRSACRACAGAPFLVNRYAVPVGDSG
jgi:cytosine/adenosine deaminase-related metal-dependent hydrolase